MPKITFLNLGEVLEIHRDQIARYGGLSGLRDLDLLKSAVAMPQATLTGSSFTPTFSKWQQPTSFTLSGTILFWTATNVSAPWPALFFWSQMATSSLRRKRNSRKSCLRLPVVTCPKPILRFSFAKGL